MAPKRSLRLNPFKRSRQHGEGSSSRPEEREEEEHRDEGSPEEAPQQERPQRLPGQEIWLDEDHPTVVFASLEQYERFQRLKVRKINSTRYLDTSVLHRMGIYDDFVALLRACGLENWVTMWEPTHKLHTLEFLSSLTPGTREGQLYLSFRLRNVTRSIDYATFCNIFGFHHELIPERQPDNTRVSELWPKIAGRLVFPNKNIYTSDVQHPVLRMFFKFARETLFPSPSPHLVRTQDVHILDRFLAPQAASPISIPLTLWKYLNHTATLQSNTEICVGGHIYRIAEHLGVARAVEFSDRFANSTTLHEQCLVRSGFIFVEPLRWRYLKDRTIPLPSNQLPPLLPYADSYLIDGNVPQYTADPPLHPPPRPRGLSSRDQPGSSGRAVASAGPDDEDSEEESDVMSSLGRIESNLQTILTTQAHHTARLDHLEQDFQRAAYPWYDFAYRSGMVSEGMVTPSWYPRHDNYYEVSLSHGFDRLRVGRRRFNNFTPPAPRAPMEGDYGMDVDVDHGDDDEQVDPGDGGFFADE